LYPEKRYLSASSCLFFPLELDELNELVELTDEELTNEKLMDEDWLEEADEDWLEEEELNGPWSIYAIPVADG
jgi:hypothetical protein